MTGPQSSNRVAVNESMLKAIRRMLPDLRDGVQVKVMLEVKYQLDQDGYRIEDARND